MNHWKKITVAASCVGASSKMAAGIGSAQIQPEHREAAVLQRDAKPPQPLTATGAAKTVQQQHQPSRRCALQVDAGIRAIQERQHFTSGCGTTGQSRDSDRNRFPTVGGKRDRAKRIAQGLKVSTDPGKTLLITMCALTS